MGAAPSSSTLVRDYLSSEESISVCSVPLEILEEIFYNVTSYEVVQHCSLVCKQWKEVADSESLWRERCRREGCLPHDASKTPKDWRIYYFLTKKRRNLIKNHRAEDNFKHWQILEDGGDHWKAEEVMVPHPNEATKNFVTSYGMCWKSQLIDLGSEGYNSALMDNFQPLIKISDWYAPRWDCGSEYKIKVKLLNQEKKVMQTFEPKTIYFKQWNDQQWNQMTHVFKNYGRGARYISFSHGGKDTKFWAGWYGIRVTDSTVEICSEVDE